MKGCVVLGAGGFIGGHLSNKIKIIGKLGTWSRYKISWLLSNNHKLEFWN